MTFLTGMMFGSRRLDLRTSWSMMTPPMAGRRSLARVLFPEPGAPDIWMRNRLERDLAWLVGGTQYHAVGKREKRARGSSMSDGEEEL